MSPKLDERPSDLYDDNDPAWRTNLDSDELEDSFNAPAASDENLPESHPDHSRNKKTEKASASVSELENAEQSADDGEKSMASPAEQSLFNPESDRVGRGYVDIGRSPLQRVTGIITRNKRRSATAGAATGILLAIFVGIMSLLPLELIHIKESMLESIGGVQSRTYRIGRNKYYSRMFFFDKNTNNFDGYKATGIRRLMGENRQTKKLMDSMRKNGFEVEFERINGEETGNVKRISFKGETIAESTEDLTKAWDVKSGSDASIKFRSALEEVFPEKSARWYGSTSNKLYRRWGLTRGNWLKEKLRSATGIDKIEKAELRFRKKLREKLFGNNSGKASLTGALTPEEEDAKKKSDPLEAATERSASDSGSQLVDGANQLPQEALENPDISATGTTAFLGEDIADVPAKTAEGAAGRAASGAVEGALNTVKLTGYADTACSIRSMLGTVEKGARYARAYQLMKFALSILTIADGAKKGKITSDQMHETMSYINKKGDDGSTFFSSGGYNYWSVTKTARVSKGNRDRYSTGGGFTGTLAQINSVINSVPGVGPGCKTLRNPGVQIGSAVGGLALGIVSGGGFTVTNAALQASLEVAKNAAFAIIPGILAPIIAGTVIDGTEKGAEIGDAFTSGFEVLNASNATNAGMRPLKKQEYTAALNSYQKEKKTEFAQMSWTERYFDLNNSESLARVALFERPSLNYQDLIPNTFAQVASIIGRPFTPQRALADAEEDQCPDQTLKDNNLASTPFCNIVPGIPDNVLESPDYQPDIVDQRMLDSGQVDENGQPTPGSDYEKYLLQCTSDTDKSRSLDVIHQGEDDTGDGAQTYTNMCTNDLFNTYRLYSTISNSESQFLAGNYEDDSAASAPNSGTTNGGVSVSPDGFAFPLKTTKDTLMNNTGTSSRWCYNKQTNCHHDYNAADIFAPTGTPVVAARSGTVISAKDRDSSSVGSRVVIKGEDGNIYYYAHMGDGTVKVTKGQTVQAGQEIGNVGTDADAVGTHHHLHFDMLPPPYTSRMACSGASCSKYPFINVQPVLSQAFQGLP